MVEASSHGQMVGDMRGIILMIKSKVLEFSCGQMVGNTKENGKMGNNMDRESTIQTRMK
jgi:hypothetical protein